LLQLWQAQLWQKVRLLLLPVISPLSTSFYAPSASLELVFAAAVAPSRRPVPSGLAAPPPELFSRHQSRL
jgi:hypothetical protein